MGHIKETVSLTDLCTTHPPQFKEFLFYTRRLKYQQVSIKMDNLSNEMPLINSILNFAP